MSQPIETLAIPFHRAAVGDEEIAALAEVIQSGWLTMGSKTLQFEEEFARYVHGAHAVAVSSCTAGLHLALDAIGLRPGEEVLVPTTTFTATAEVVTYLGGRPVLVDVDAKTLNMDPADAESRISSRTRAIIPVHLAGQPCNMHQIHALAKRHKLAVIEDAAHALPASFRGNVVGSMSDFTVFSFYATKTLTTGEGGMVTTGNLQAAERMRMMRLHGIANDGWKRYQSSRWYYEVRQAGFKYNFTDLQAALGIVQLKKCDAMRDARRRIAGRYSKAFESIEALETPYTLDDRETSWHLYILRLRLNTLDIDRSQFVDSLAKRGVGTSVHFIPLHLHPYYRQTFGYRSGDFPVAEQEYPRCISLPIFPSMTDDDVDYVINAVTKVAERHICHSAVGSNVKP